MQGTRNHKLQTTKPKIVNSKFQTLLSSTIFHSRCPVCDALNIRKVLSAKDHTVSNEVFEIWECSTCTLRFTQNIPDQLSIGKYYQSENYISHSNTDKGIINRLYHAVRQFTLKGKKNLIQRHTHLSKGNLLDIGAGTGVFAACMQNAGWTVTGLEPDDDARRKATELNNIFLKEPDELFQLPSKSFDAITMWHVLEHVHELHAYIEQIKDILKANGIIFIAVPNYTSKDASHYNEAWAAYDVPRHLYHFSPTAMKILLEKHGLKLKTIQPMWFDGFYVSLLSEKYKTGKGNLLKGFLSGIASNSKTVLQKDKCSSIIYIVTN